MSSSIHEWGTCRVKGDAGCWGSASGRDHTTWASMNNSAGNPSGSKIPVSLAVPWRRGRAKLIFFSISVNTFQGTPFDHIPNASRVALVPGRGPGNTEIHTSYINTINYICPYVPPGMRHRYIGYEFHEPYHTHGSGDTVVSYNLIRTFWRSFRA